MSEEVIVEETPKFDPKQIEQEMLNAAQNRVEDPAETAAMVYHMYRPEFLKRVQKLSSRGKLRVLEALVQFPLSGTNHFPNELEKEVYILADSMIQAKFCLMMDTYKEGAEHLVNAQDNLFKGMITEDVTFNKVEEASTNEGDK